MDKATILQATNGGLDIYQHVLDKLKSGIQLKSGKNHGLLNPFYDDKNGSLSISFNSHSNQYLFRDFGNEEFQGDAFDFYARLEGLSTRQHFAKIIDKVLQNVLNQKENCNKNTDHFSSSSKKGTKPEIMTKPEITPKDFVTKSLPKMEFCNNFQYWEDLFPKIQHVKEKAHEFGLHSLKSISYNDQKLQKISKLISIFAFEVQKEAFKVYMPKSDKNKHWWIQKPTDLHSNFVNLIKENEPVLICEGYKDAFSGYLHSFNVIPHDNASIPVDKKLIEMLLAKNCVPIFCFDNDEAGMKAAEKAEFTFKLPSLHLPNEVNGKNVKDLTDFLQHSSDLNSFRTNVKDIAKKARMSHPKLEKVFWSRSIVLENAGKVVKKDNPMITFNGKPIIYPETLNIIQGASGTHKSRMAECIVSALIQADGSEVATMQRNANLKPVRVIYTDTERNQRFQFPKAIQQMRTNGGYDAFKHNSLLEPISLINVKRNERMSYLRSFLNSHIAQSTDPIVVVIDILTDCTLSFNEVGETMDLTDMMNEMINQYGVTFIGIIHSNPGTQKARGHLGTEVMNKASYMVAMNMEGNVIQVKCLKQRNARPHGEVILAFDEDLKQLRLASEIERFNSSKKQDKNKILDLISEKEPDIDHPTKSLKDKIQNICECSPRTAEYRLKEISDERIPIDANGTICYLELKRGKFRLVPKQKETQGKLLDKAA
jgi:hypothetical protein